MLPTFKLQNLAATAQADVPVTFGHVFAPGDFKADRGLLGGASDGTYLPIQVDVKATHPDGSVRHAILSAVVPAIGGKGTRTYRLLDADKRTSTMPPRETHATVELVIGRVDYVAKLDTHPLGAPWLSGPVVLEQQFAVPFVAADGTKHPHLMARFAVRDYGTSTRFDVTVENNWAFEPGPQNFKYDATVSIGGLVVYSKAGLTHLAHARWRKVFWAGTAPQINVQIDSAYLIASRAVPNYDMSFPPSESMLGGYAKVAVEPMKLGLSSGYMPTTGADAGIGILPQWSAAYIMSMDARARDATLATADMAGSYSMHYRDKNTDRPVSLINYPYMTTVAGNSVTWDEARKQYDAFPAYGNDRAAAGLLLPQSLNPDGTPNGDDVPWHSPYTHDTAHQPSLAYIPYLVTGDYYYLEELQFWAMYDVFSSNPGYRDNIKGILQSEQTRGQAWSLRTLAEAAYITPDADPLKKDFNFFLDSNFDWYINTYINGAEKRYANDLGVITSGFALSYDNGRSIAPWQDDFFTAALGHTAELGFAKAAHLMKWKAKSPLGRMTTPGVCWIDAAKYSMPVRDSDSSPFYADWKQVQLATRGADFMALPCGGADMAKALGTKIGDMGQLSEYYMGYPANMQPALAYAVAYDPINGPLAYQRFKSRTVKPDYTQGAQFAIIPRAALPTLPEGNTMTFKITIDGFDSAVQQLAPGSESALTSIRSRIMSPDGTKVLSESATLPHVLGGLEAGLYPVEIAALDSTGAVMGTAATLTIDTASAPVVTPPALPVSVSLPSAIRASVAQEV